MAAARALLAVLHGNYDLEEKLKLIAKINQSDKLNAIDKDGILIDWLLETIQNSRQDVASNNTLPIWSTLYDTLERLSQTSNSSTVSFNPKYINVFLECIKDSNTQDPSMLISLKSISILLHLSLVNNTVKFSSDTLLAFLFGILETSCRLFIEKSNLLNEINKLINIVIDLLDNLSYNMNNTKVPLFTHSLQEISSFFYFASKEEIFHPVCKRLAQKINLIIFNSKTKFYHSLLVINAESKEDEKPNANLSEFFVAVRKLLKKKKIYENISGQMVCSSLLKNIMSSSLEQNRSCLEALLILALLCAVSGLDIPLLTTADSCCNMSFKKIDSSLSLLPLSHLLEACEPYPEYFLFPDVPENCVKPADWLAVLAVALFDMQATSEASIWLKCCRHLLKIMPVTLVENNIINLIKLGLINIDVEELDAKQEYCDYFKDLISVYAQLHQLPKFFVKFLLSLTECIKDGVVGKLIIKGQIFPEMQNSLVTYFQDLPFGQILDLWKIFSETYTSFANMNEIFSSGKGALFLLAQLYSAFLLHSKLFDITVPENVFMKFGDLIQQTSKELEKNNCICDNSSNKSLYFQRSFLLSCFAVGEVKLAYNYFADKSFDDINTLKHSNHPLDFSLLHSFLDETHAESFNSLLKNEDKILSLLVFQLLAQKIKGYLSKKEISEEEKLHLQICISTLVQHVQENCLADSSWDSDLSTLNETNYSCGVWKVFLKVLPSLMNDLSHKDLLAITDCVHDILQKSSETSNETSLYYIILSSLESGYFSESKSFQTAYVASLWKFDNNFLHRKRPYEEMEIQVISFNDVLMKLSIFRSKWIKHAETKPKCGSDDTSNSLWDSLKDACLTLNQVLINGSSLKIKIKAKIYSKIKLLNFLPVEYLLPCNQMRCVVGLSVLFFLLPDTCNADEVLKIAEQIAVCLMAIFDGVRSIWLFDFVPSGLYLQEIVNVITKLMEMTQTEEIWSWAKLLLSCMMKKVTVNYNIFLDLHSYLKKMGKEVSSQNNKVYILSLVYIFENIIQIAQKAHVSPEFKEAYQKIFTSSSHCFLKFLKLYYKNSQEDTPSVLLSCYMKIIEIINSSICPVDQKIQSICMESIASIALFSKNKISDQNVEHEIYLKFISKIYNLNSNFSSFLPENFPIIAWEAILLHLQNKKFISTNVTLTDKSDNNHSCNICASFTSNVSSMNPIVLEEYEVEVLKSALHSIPENLLSKAFEKVSSNMINLQISNLNVYSLQVDLIIVRYFVESLQDNNRASNISELFMNLLNHLLWLINELCQAEFFLNMVKIPILELIHLIVKSRESCIQRSSLISCLHSCLAIKFEQLTYSLPKFIKSFNTVWSIVYDLLVYHPKITLSSRAAYLSFVAMLLRQLVRATSQDNFCKYDTDIQLQMKLCAQNMDRLLTVLARHKTELSKLVPYLIADYVDNVQHITVESSIKIHLISGINRLFDLCSEDSVKMLAVNVNPSCRDIYANLVKYNKQHRYQGAV